MSRCAHLSLLLVIATGSTSAAARGESADDLLKQARQAWAAGKRADALSIAGRAIAADPKNAQALLLRGQMNDSLGKYDAAVTDFSHCVELNAKLAEAYDLRGSSQFKRRKISDSIADFDRFLAMRPREAPGHWRRGIALYYAGRYADGRDQFKGYESVDTNDVENAVWHFLCGAKIDGVAKARTAMLKVGKDKRVPMTEVYELYQGKLKPADVLAAAEAGEAAEGERADRRFYAHLYVGLFYDVSGDPMKALEHIGLAAGKYGSSQYMGDVARVHAKILREGAPSK